MCFFNLFDDDDDDDDGLVEVLGDDSGISMDVKRQYGEMGLVGRIVMEWARRAEIGVGGWMVGVQGPAVRMTVSASMVLGSEVWESL